MILEVGGVLLLSLIIKRIYNLLCSQWVVEHYMSYVWPFEAFDCWCNYLTWKGRMWGTFVPHDLEHREKYLNTVQIFTYFVYKRA